MEVRAFPNGPLMNLTGTVQQIRTQLLALNPNYMSDFNIPTSLTDRSPLSPSTSTSPTSLHKRQHPFGVYCGRTDYIGDDGAWGPDLDVDINFLRHVPGRATIGAGPATCARVACYASGSPSWASTINWCNDNAEPFSLDGFYVIADCAQVLAWQCQGFGINRGVLGQNFVSAKSGLSCWDGY